VRLADALGKSEWKDDAAFATAGARRKNREKMNQAIESVTVTRNSDQWIRLLNDAGVPCGPIYSIDQMFADPHIKQLGQVKQVHHKKLGELNVVGQAATLSRTPSSMRLAAPDLGEHTAEALRALGLTAERIAELKKRQVI
jgi:crotonobetainyl-CoA:carnitine CoA-transferase CaiB-like acyl-CoA transferase